MSRIPIQKTYKIFIGGKFPRTESGRHYTLKSKNGNLLANLCLSSRKDVRNAVVAARKAQGTWSGLTAYNRSQILYRLAEMLEHRRSSFVEEMKTSGLTKKQAEVQVNGSIDRLVYYAGWCDKYTALFSSVNPTASSHFNFSVHEPMGVITAVAPQEGPLLGLISTIVPVIAGGNAVVVLASYDNATSAISFAEVIQNSDVPAGVVNIITGSPTELVPHLLSHMDVNATVLARSGDYTTYLLGSTANVKRLIDWRADWNEQRPYKILDAQEVKTTWHPVQVSASAGGGY